VRPQVVDFFGTPPVIEPSPVQVSGDAEPLPIRAPDKPAGRPS
jgi:hypothetical protein